MFIVLPVGMNYQTERLPIVTFTLMGLNILVYLVSLPFTFGQESQGMLWIFEHLWLIPAYTPWYSYLTAMFVHAGFFHLLGNMLYLFLFGACVEDIIGRWRFAMLYLIGGLAADLVYIALTPDHFASEVPMGGASGAISVCMGAYLLLRSNVDIEFKYFGLLFFKFFSGEFSLAAWVVISFWFLKDLFFAGLSYYQNEHGGGVAFGAHVGGLMFGAAVLGIRKLLPAKTTQAKKEPIRVNLARPVARADPADSPTIFLYQGETQYGPYNLSQIREMLAQGSVVSEAQYWCEGMPEWRNVIELTRASPKLV